MNKDQKIAQFQESNENFSSEIKILHSLSKKITRKLQQ